MDFCTLRPAAPEDTEFLLRVYASTRAAELAQAGWNAAQCDTFLRMQFMAQDSDYRRNFPHARFDVVECAGDDVGRLYIEPGGDEIILLDIALLPAHRGRGLGTALLRRLLAEGQRRGLPVCLHVETLNPAAALYRRLGFDIEEEQDFRRLMRWRPAAHSARQACCL